MRVAQVLGLQAQGRFGEDDIAWIGTSASNEMRTVADLAAIVERKLGRVPTVIGDLNQELDQVAWCTGAAHSMLGNAIEAGAKVFISGEISEPTVHLAREAGVVYMACGHHATERYGVQALGRFVEEQFGIEQQFVDIANPV